ncbi:hypothetical protein CsSME_00042167 [Camellia sinensis var. sinensis]
MSWTARYTQRERENHARATPLHHPQRTAPEEQKPYQHQKTRHKLHPHLVPDRQRYRLVAKLRRSSSAAAQHTAFGAPAICVVVFFSGTTPTTHNQKDSSPYTKSHKQSTRNTGNLI